MTDWFVSTEGYVDIGCTKTFVLLDEAYVNLPSRKLSGCVVVTLCVHDVDLLLYSSVKNCCPHIVMYTSQSDGKSRGLYTENSRARPQTENVRYEYPKRDSVQWLYIYCAVVPGQKKIYMLTY